MKSERLVSLDALRGLIMILMAVDHASYFIGKRHPAEFWGLDLPRYEGAADFLTRFITHPCAPGFFFLMGTGMALFAASRRELGWKEGRIRRFFFLRGLILIGLELNVVNLAWLMGMKSSRNDIQSMGPGGGGEVMIAFLVLSALGLSMILAAGLLRLTPTALFAAGTAAVAVSQALVPAAAKAGTLFHPVLRILAIPGQTGMMSAMYSVLPWFGVTVIGMGFGRLIARARGKAFSLAGRAGLAFLILFPIVRASGGFGNIHPPRAGWMGFLNLTKYPPSLGFLLLMLGLVGILLWLFENVRGVFSGWAKPVLVYGKAPLFFYVLHMFLFAFLGFLFPDGASLPVIYLFWLLVTAGLFPLAAGYGRFKRRSPPNSIWRFF